MKPTLLLAALALTACAPATDTRVADTFDGCASQATTILGDNPFGDPDTKFASLDGQTASIDTDVESKGRYAEWATLVAGCLIVSLASDGLQAKFNATTGMAGVQDETEDGIRFVWSFSSPDLSLTITTED